MNELVADSLFYTCSLFFFFFYSTYVVFKCFGNKVMIVMMKCMGADMHTQTLVLISSSINFVVGLQSSVL